MKRKLTLVKNLSVASAKPCARGLLADLREMILATRQTVAQEINSALVLLYWKIGQRIRTDILKEKRAGYGEKILHTLSAKLATEFGRGFSERNLANMVRCAEAFSDAKILHTLCAKLSWSHFRRIIYLDDPLKRDFYAEMCRIEQWSVRTLHEKMKIGDFEAGDKGQMELYLNWLKRYECVPDEAEPLGLILCAGKTDQHVELMELEKSHIHVATYWTKVLPKKLLERKLHDAVLLARARLTETQEERK